MSDKSKDIIEENKEKLNLRKNIEFVARYIPIYNEGLQRLLNAEASKESQKFADRIEFDNLDAIIQPQVTPEEAKRLLSAMPLPLIRLSNLLKIQYVGMIPIPNYDEDGNFSGNVEWVDYNEFPRQIDHPSRILVGLSNGTTIYPTPIPKTVSDNETAKKIYQIHVFLHEFFHTIDYPRRNQKNREAIREAIVLEFEGMQFTLQNFWNDFERLYLNEDKNSGISVRGKRFVSRYAATYADKLNEETRTAEPIKFDSALGEQICESFVGYILGIIPNDYYAFSFKHEHPIEYKLMERLCNAKLVSTN